MPLRDHFPPPLDRFLATWESVLGMWPAMIAFRLNDVLPPEFRAGVRVLLEPEESPHAVYEVPVYDAEERLVAAIELVSPCNKNRPQSRKAFVDKCHAMLQQDVCVVIVDTVTCLSSNLYAELAERLRAKEHGIADSSIYAVTCRTRTSQGAVRAEVWEHPLAVTSPLPTMPLFLTETLSVPLELESTYEKTCRGLRIA